MTVFSFQQYQPMLTDKVKGEEVYQAIKNLHPESEQIVVDMENMVSMATYCARQIFGRLYVELGASTFQQNIVLKNVSEDIEYIIKWGIQRELDAQ